MIIMIYINESIRDLMVRLIIHTTHGNFKIRKKSTRTPSGYRADARSASALRVHLAACKLITVH